VIATQGIAGNWIWWTSCLGGMLTVFFFARYWRRAEVLTDVELTEMRYGGKPAAFLRGFKAIYLGLAMNCLILGWVTNAMVSIIAVLAGAADCARQSGGTRAGWAHSAALHPRSTQPQPRC